MFLTRHGRRIARFQFQDQGVFVSLVKYDGTQLPLCVVDSKDVAKELVKTIDTELIDRLGEPIPVSARINAVINNN